MKTYLVCCFPAQISYWKTFVFKIWAKMFSASQIGRCFSQPYLQNKSVKQPDYLHVDTNSHRLNVDQIFFEWA